MVRTTIISLLGIIILVTIVVIVQGDVGDGVCVDFGNAKETACGFTVDSDYGNGAVELCQDCFACGYADDICPQDFGVNCSQCCDPDCLINVSGRVTGPMGEAIINAEVIVDLDHLTPYFTRTDDNGDYKIEVPRCECNIRINAEGYPYIDIPVPYEQAAPIQNLDTIVTIPDCSAECTTWDSIAGGTKCQTICEGDNGCNPQTAPYPVALDPFGAVTKDLLEECQRMAANETTDVYLGAINATTQLWGKCCEGPVYTTNWIKSIELETNATDVAQKSIPVTYEGDNVIISGVKFHVITYKNKQS